MNPTIPVPTDLVRKLPTAGPALKALEDHIDNMTLMLRFDIVDVLFLTKYCYTHNAEADEYKLDMFRSEEAAMQHAKNECDDEEVGRLFYRLIKAFEEDTGLKLLNNSEEHEEVWRFEAEGAYDLNNRGRDFLKLKRNHK